MRTCCCLIASILPSAGLNAASACSCTGSPLTCHCQPGFIGTARSPDAKVSMLQSLQRWCTDAWTSVGLTLDSTGSLAMSLMMGGTSRGVPLLSLHRQLARSNLKPSTWYSSTHLTISSHTSLSCAATSLRVGQVWLRPNAFTARNCR